VLIRIVRIPLPAKDMGIAERFPMSTNHTLTLILREDAVITGLELNYTEEPVCPYCGHKDHDAWGINFGGMEGETVSSCGNCGEYYTITRQVTIYYSTSK